MKAIILNVGNEVLFGKTINTNASFLALQLESLGIDLIKTTIVGDDAEAIGAELSSFINSDVDLFITTGGLGPTHDDFTKEVICSVLGVDLTYNAYAAEDMFNYFGVKKNDCNVKQTYFPKQSIIIPNVLGSADGMILSYHQKLIITLVGPPYELEPMFINHVKAYLQQYGNKKLIKDYVVMGNSESFFEGYMEDILLSYRQYIAPYASNGVIRYRILCDGTQNQLFDEINNRFVEKMAPYIIGENEDTIEGVLSEFCHHHQLTISFAESCTGGMLSSMITSIPNASQIFHESFVTYNLEAKQKRLHIDYSILEAHDVVSEAVAKAMVYGLSEEVKSDICVAVTGYAGPSGKDVGKVCYAILFRKHLLLETNRFRGNRDMIRIRASRYILYQTYQFVKRIINEENNGKQKT